MGFFDNLKQLNEVKQQMEDLKRKMDSVEITCENEYLLIKGNANRKVLDVQLKKPLTEMDSLLLERYIKDAVQDLNTKTDAAMQQEAMSLTKGIIPGM